MAQLWLVATSLWLLSVWDPFVLPELWVAFVLWVVIVSFEWFKLSPAS